MLDISIPGTNIWKLLFVGLSGNRTKRRFKKSESDWLVAHIKGKGAPGGCVHMEHTSKVSSKLDIVSMANTNAHSSWASLFLCLCCIHHVIG